MIGVAGILAAELTGAAEGVGNRWWEVGGKDYGVSMAPLTAIELALFGCLENLRLQGFKEGKVTLFDPMGNASNESMQVREIKNGRLAMIAFFGFFAQITTTYEGPIAGLQKHMADPLNYNILQNLLHNADRVRLYYADLQYV